MAHHHADASHATNREQCEDPRAAKSTSSRSEEPSDVRCHYARELIARDKASLDVFWLRDEGMADLDDLPEPDVLAEEIVEHLQAALASFEAVAATTSTRETV